MNWVQPKFTDFIVPPAKKPKTDDGQVKKVKHVEKSTEEVAWLNKWKPNKKTDLVVNKKKIEEVERWLEETKSKRGSSFLLMYGPPGCGKLTTLKVLCNECGICLIEWIPQIQQSRYDPDSFIDVPYQSELSVFNDFVTRATRYSSVLTRNSCRIVVVKDIPSQFIKDNNLFQKFLETFMNVDNVNVVFIMTDFKITRELFSDDIKWKYNIQTIQFNPVTQRNTLTVLQKISKGKFSEYLDSISLSSAGDLRNAITTLQFLSAKGALPHNRKKQPIPANAKSDSIDLFHGIGRILYAKREDNGKLTHCPIEVAESFTSTPDLFVNMLHENYLATFSSVHEIAKASNCLVESDLLLKPMDSSFSSESLSVASNALMSYNSNPVKKFQQFNRPTRIYNRLIEYKSVGKDSESLIDIISYGRIIPTFSILHKEMFSKVKSFEDFFM